MHIVFYEKPGCVGNARQKAILAVAGHSLEVRDLLTYPFRPEELRAFFGATAVRDWFNPSAPRLKSGELSIDGLSEDEALSLLLADRLLIRRPLLAIDERRVAGFGLTELERLLGRLQFPDGTTLAQGQNLEACPGQSSGYRCPEPKARSASAKERDTSSERTESHPVQR